MSDQPSNPPDRDVMACRWCGKEERASEGYPCLGCGTFLCLICSFRGHQYCVKCEQSGAATVRS
jgi:hypothetical protein